MNFEIAPKNTWLTDSHYAQGAMYCLFLEHDGKKGWRLPTANEANVLVSIIDPTDDEHKIVVPPHLQEFTDYWFDTETLGFWTLENDNDEDHQFSVIPVRDIK